MRSLDEPEPFDGPPPGAPREAETLIVDIEGYEGPLDLLLTLARAQKVDLARISILALVEQYLAFIEAARRLELELAADYLVMAAWLAYLKSRLLLPRGEDEEEPTAEELAVRLQLRLQRLEAMREAGAALMARDRMGRDTFPRGAPEGLSLTRHPVPHTTLYELLRAYADFRLRRSHKPLEIRRRPVYSLEAALRRLEQVIGARFSWTRLLEFLPGDSDDPRIRRSALASLFAASLELARQGKAEIRQMETFGPLYLRAGQARNPSHDRD
ncbi:MAG: ScpA family protein [Rhodothalassiaceae bacterium]